MATNAHRWRVLGSLPAHINPHNFVVSEGTAATAKQAELSAYRAIIADSTLGDRATYGVYVDGNRGPARLSPERAASLASALEIIARDEICT